MNRTLLEGEIIVRVLISDTRYNDSLPDIGVIQWHVIVKDDQGVW